MPEARCSASTYSEEANLRICLCEGDAVHFPPEFIWDRLADMENKKKTEAIGPKVTVSNDA